MDLNNRRKFRNHRFVPKFKANKVKEVVKKIKIDKSMGPNSVPVKIQKSLGHQEIFWLTRLFNKILRFRMMPNE